MEGIRKEKIKKRRKSERQTNYRGSIISDKYKSLSPVLLLRAAALSALSFCSLPGPQQKVGVLI
jgi:hypothetical protein